MRIKSLKRVLWVLNTLLVVGIVLVALKFFILDGTKNRKARAAPEILGTNNLPRAKPKVDTRDILPVASYRCIFSVPIDGDLPPEPVAEEAAAGPVEVRTNLEREYELRWVKVHPDPFESMAHLVSKADKSKIIAIQPGQKLAGWILVEVRIEEADFEEEKTGEKVTLKQVKTDLPVLDSGGESGGGTPATLATAEDSGPPPREGPTEVATLRVRESNESRQVWDMPEAEARWWSEYGEEEAQNVAVQTRKDPETGRPDGVEIRKVAQGSLIARRGVMAGDVIKSINGVPVNSREEAVAYVKGPGKGRARYDVVIERRGKLINFTYNVRQR